MLHKSSFIDGIIQSLPVCIAFFIISFSFGMLANLNGITCLSATIMTITIFALPTQILIMENQDLSLLALSIKIVILNIKFMLMSSYISPFFKKSKIFIIPALHFMCNSTYMLSVVNKKTYANQNQKDLLSFYIGTAALCYVIAIIGTAAGHLMWSLAASFQTSYQVFFQSLAYIVLPIHLMCLTLKRKSDSFAMCATLLGFLLSPILTAAIGRQFTIIAWLVIGFMILKYEKRYA